jgi:hypothetical protein
VQVFTTTEVNTEPSEQWVCTAFRLGWPEGRVHDPTAPVASSFRTNSGHPALMDLQLIQHLGGMDIDDMGPGAMVVFGDTQQPAQQHEHLHEHQPLPTDEWQGAPMGYQILLWIPKDLQGSEHGLAACRTQPYKGSFLPFCHALSKSFRDRTQTNGGTYSLWSMVPRSTL